MTSFELRQYAEARRACLAALAEARRPLTDAQRAHVEALRERAEAFLGRVEVRVEVPGARLELAGAPVDPQDGAVWLDLGAHELTVHAPGHASRARRFTIAGGERLVWEVALVPDATPVDDPTARAPARAPPRAADHGPALALLVAGGGVLALSAVGLGLWLERDGELGRCRARPCSNEDRLREQRDVAAGLTAAGAVLAAALASAGLALWLVADAGPSAQLACGPGGPLLECALAW
ncbi:MAG: hypothetical protein KF729_30580 [Sandaracinaceae bacterium]|nr:hypothetical protein [Sandaracinaceae bacterium]